MREKLFLSGRILIFFLLYSAVSGCSVNETRFVDNVSSDISGSVAESGDRKDATSTKNKTNFSDKYKEAKGARKKAQEFRKQSALTRKSAQAVRAKAWRIRSDLVKEHKNDSKKVRVTDIKLKLGVLGKINKEAEKAHREAIRRASIAKTAHSSFLNLIRFRNISSNYGLDSLESRIDRAEERSTKVEKLVHAEEMRSQLAEINAQMLDRKSALIASKVLRGILGKSTKYKNISLDPQTIIFNQNKLIQMQDEEIKAKTNEERLLNEKLENANAENAELERKNAKLEKEIQSKLKYSTDHLVSLKNFPWPPPAFSAKSDLKITLRNSNATFGHISKLIKFTLAEAGFHELGYYRAPNGFAIVTEVQKMDLEGRSFSSTKHQGLSLRQLLHGLVFAKNDRYRMFVFLVSDLAFSAGILKIDVKESQDYSSKGANKLTSNVSNQAFSESHEVSVLVYDFKRQNNKKSSNLISDRLKVNEHLKGIRWFEAAEKTKTDINLKAYFNSNSGV